MKFHLSRFCALSFLLLPSAWAASNNDNYVLRPNDVISLSVYEEQDLSVKVRILKTGQASFPLIGSVDVSGLSVANASEKIRELYEKDYLVNPKLTLAVDEYSTDYVSVIGAVKSSGQLPIPASGNLDLGSAIASAGGVSDNADLQRIQLIRAGGSSATYTLEQIQGSAGRIVLQPGDRIIVNESLYVRKYVSILGQVRTPGAVPFPLDGKLDLVTAIAKAGGLTDLANPRKISINRKGTVTVVDFKEISQRGDIPYTLQPDDIITVAERLF